MAKKGMRRFSLRQEELKDKRPRNEVEPVTELQGKAKQSNEKAKPIEEWD